MVDVTMIMACIRILWGCSWCWLNPSVYVVQRPQRRSAAGRLDGIHSAGWRLGEENQPGRLCFYPVVWSKGAMAAMGIRIPIYSHIFPVKWGAKELLANHLTGVNMRRYIPQMVVLPGKMMTFPVVSTREPTPGKHFQEWVTPDCPDIQPASVEWFQKIRRKINEQMQDIQIRWRLNNWIIFRWNTCETWNQEKLLEFKPTRIGVVFSNMFFDWKCSKLEKVIQQTNLLFSSIHEGSWSWLTWIWGDIQYKCCLISRCFGSPNSSNHQVSSLRRESQDTQSDARQFQVQPRLQLVRYIQQKHLKAKL